MNSKEVTPEMLDVKGDDIVIAVTSVIFTSSSPIDGFEKRSVFTMFERYEQTIRQLLSIREKIPNAVTFLLEGSLFLPDEMVKELQKLCSYVILYSDNEDAKKYCNESYNKGLGEMYVTSHLGTLLRNKQFSIFCKFNGRSVFTPEFDINLFIKPFPVVKCLKGNGRLGILCFSNFYSIPKRYMNAYTEHILCWLSPETREPIEHVLTMFIESIQNQFSIETLNICGCSSVTGEKIPL